MLADAGGKGPEQGNDARLKKELEERERKRKRERERREREQQERKKKTAILVVDKSDRKVDIQKPGPTVQISQAPAKPVTAITKLRGGSEFTCPIKFLTTLPDLPFDTKILKYPFNPKRFVNYAPTSLDQSFKSPLLSEPDLGIPIDMIDQEAYSCPPDAELHPTDLFLIDTTVDVQQPTTAKQNVTVPISKREAKRDRPNVTWLRKTEYLSADYENEQLYTRSKKADSGGSQAAAKKTEEEEDNYDDHIAAIEESFEEAKRPPVHPTKKHLQPVSIMPLLPDYSLMEDNFVQTQFDADPCPVEMDLTKPDKAKLHESVMAHSILRVITIEDKKMVAFLLPRAMVKKAEKAEGQSASENKAADDNDEDALFGDDKESDSEEDMFGEGKAVDYMWVREFKFDIEQAQERSSFVFMFDDERGDVRFIPVDAKANLRRALNKRKQTQQIALSVPRAVTVEMPSSVDGQAEAALEGGALEDMQEDEVSPPDAGEAD